MLTVMLRMLGIVCILGALLGGAAAARGFRGGPQMGFGPHPRFFPHPGFVPRPGFGPHRAFVPGRAFDNRRFFFGGVFVAPPILAPPYPVYPYIPTIIPPILTRHIPSVQRERLPAYNDGESLCARMAWLGRSRSSSTYRSLVDDLASVKRPCPMNDWFAF